MQRALFSAVLVTIGTSASDNGRARSPPMGWRDWNQFGCEAADQTMMETAFHAMVDTSRTVNGTRTSLRQLGYSDVGLDDCWQAMGHPPDDCGAHGPERWTYHDELGRPLIDLHKFPDMKAMTTLGHSLNLTVGWYHNNCRCHDHCSSPVCFAADVNATLALGFDSVKLDGCGAEEDVALWDALFNHSIRVMDSSSTAGGQPGMLIENCHNGIYTKDFGPPSAWPGNHNYPWSQNGSAGYNLRNLPYRDEKDELKCPFHTYRSSTDIRAIWGSILVNLNTIPALADARLSGPGCWANPDMLEVGVSPTWRHWYDCGPHQNETCPGLTMTESRSHFGAWCIVSAPLVLGFNFSDTANTDKHWSTVTNPDAIDVNQDWAGFSGSLFASSTELTTVTPCTGGSAGGDPNGTQCVFPATQSWYKPLSGRDARRSIMAVLLVNNDQQPRDIGFTWNQVPGLEGQELDKYCLYDVWAGHELDGGRFGGFIAKDVAPHDTVFLKLGGCL